MPTKRLPTTLVKRLSTWAKRSVKRDPTRAQLFQTLGKMKNVDHRKHLVDAPVEKTDVAGRRIREMNVHRNYPLTGLVLKRTHRYSAKKIRRIVAERIFWHNLKYRWRDPSYRLLYPRSYAIDRKVLAMSKATYPSLEELLGVETRKTLRGTKFFDQLKRDHGFSARDFRHAAKRVINRTTFGAQNILLVGFEKNRFLFMPLVDVH